VVDIDGVLADVRHRLPHLRSRPRDWDAFFAAAPADPVLEVGVAVVQQLAAEHEVVLVSGRPERCRRDTLRWLRKLKLPVSSLLLRPEGDRRPARQLKVEILRDLARRRSVALVVDDDPAVCAAAAAAGFAVFQATWMAPDEGPEQDLFSAQEVEGET
jgi:hypothetical protein